MGKDKRHRQFVWKVLMKIVKKFVFLIIFKNKILFKKLNEKKKIVSCKNF